VTRVPPPHPLVQGAERDVQQDVKSEVKEAVKEAIEQAVAGSDSLLTGSKRGTHLLHSLVKDAGKEAAKAGAEEMKQYGTEMSHITQELDSQLGGLVELHSDKARVGVAGDSSSSSSSSAGVGKKNKDWVSLATKVLQRQEHSGGGWAQERANSKKEVLRALKEKEQLAQEEKTIKQETKYEEGKSKKDVPFGSRKNPMYMRAEEKRDKQADSYFKKLEIIREAKAARRKHAKQREHHRGESRTAQADKYLKVMEKPVLKKVVHKHEDRNVLAAKYLQELVKDKPELEHKSRSVMEQHALAKKKEDYEEAETLKAERDMKLLKKGVAVVKRGNKVEKVKLNPIIVQGVDVVQEEKKALMHPHGADRDVLAQKYLKKLKTHPTVGVPFHALPLPKTLLKQQRLNLNTKAQKYLKELDKARKPASAPQHVDRNKIAQLDLEKQEKAAGTWGRQEEMSGK
jgi:hypothetical protein